MKNLKLAILIPAMLAAVSLTLATNAQEPSPTPNSAGDSRKSDIRVGTRALLPARDTDVEVRAAVPPAAAASGQKGPRSDVIAACSAAVDELKASRDLITALDAELESLRARLETEKRTTALLTELSDTRRAESDALRHTLDAKNETIAAKDAVIATQARLIDTLKAKRPSPWRRIGDILLGAGAAMILK